MQEISYATFVLKTVERCNINCTYCYFFNGKDKSFKKHPPYISRHTVAQVAQYISQAATTLNLKEIYLSFHGGEPLMQKIFDFDDMCHQLRKLIPSTTRLFFSVQTNGMLLNDDWLAVLNKHKVQVGISLDGTQAYHDQYRIDKKGKGTYERVIRGIKRIQDHANLKRNFGVLCVINPHANGKEIYRYFVDCLQIEHIDFLLPEGLLKNNLNNFQSNGCMV